MEEISSCEQNQVKSFTNKYQKHKPSGFCYKIVCFDEKLFNQKPVLYTAKNDKDIGEKFVEILEEDIKRIHKKFEFSKKMIFTFKDKGDFEKAKICRICQKEFKGEITVILLENIAGRLITFAILFSRKQILLP